MTSSSVFMTTAYMNFSVIWIIKWNLIALQQCHGKYLALFDSEYMIYTQVVDLLKTHF